jgi:hypothetical protein
MVPILSITTLIFVELVLNLRIVRSAESICWNIMLTQCVLKL